MAASERLSACVTKSTSPLYEISGGRSNSSRKIPPASRAISTAAFKYSSLTTNLGRALPAGRRYSLYHLPPDFRGACRVWRQRRRRTSTQSLFKVAQDSLL